MEYFQQFIESLPKYISIEDRSRITEDVSSIYDNYDTQAKKKNGIVRCMLFGEVQSGKTNAMIGSMTMGLDKGFNLIIILGGVNKLLLSQTSERAEKPLVTEEFRGVNVFNRDELMTSVNISKVARIINKKSSSSVILTMKESKNLNNVLKLMKEIYPNEMKILVIDDEVDNASINIGKKTSDSLIFNQLHQICAQINEGLYIGVTATPYANLFSKKSSSMYPDFLTMIRHNSLYTGLDYFTSNKQLFRESVAIKTDYRTWVPIIEEGLIEYIIRSFLISKSNNSIQIKNEFLINVDLSIDAHFKVENMIKMQIMKIRQRIHSCNPIKTLVNIKRALEIKENEGTWIKDWNSEFVLHIIDFLQCINDRIIILAGEQNDYQSGTEKHTIIIGGSLVSRGFTFNNLLVQILLNAPEEKIAADTLLQRARWFGYRFDKHRNKFIQIITTKNILDYYDKCIVLQQKLKEFISLTRDGKKSLNIDEARNFFGKDLIELSTNKV